MTKQPEGPTEVLPLFHPCIFLNCNVNIQFTIVHVCWVGNTAASVVVIGWPSPVLSKLGYNNIWIPFPASAGTYAIFEYPIPLSEKLMHQQDLEIFMVDEIFYLGVEKG